jgi:beta-lactamase class A
MVGFAMVAMAFLASALMVRGLATPKAATARADQATIQTTAAATAAPSPTVTPASQGLQALLDTFAAANPGMSSLYVKDLKTGAVASVNADRSMTSASLYSCLWPTDLAARRFRPARLARQRGGTGRTVDGCLKILITISDIGCGRALGDILGWGKQNQSLNVEGYTGTSLATPQRTSARDLASLFERLYNGTLLSPGSTKEFTDLLKKQRVNNRLPQGIPAGTVFAHKTGDLDGYVHDAGIVYGPKTDYLVVAMSGSWKLPSNAPAQFAKLSSQLWGYFER